jgi:hypothetical protein
VRFCGVKYVRRHALDVGGRQALEDVELPVGGRDVVVDDGVRQHARLVLIRLAVEDVIARELVLRALQITVADRLVLQPVELGNERVDRLIGRAPRLHDRHRVEEIRILDEVRPAKRGDGQLLFIRACL